jgi:hypothetical protein
MESGRKPLLMESERRACDAFAESQLTADVRIYPLAKPEPEPDIEKLSPGSPGSGRSIEAEEEGKAA